MGFDTRRSGGISLVTQTTLFLFQRPDRRDVYRSEHPKLRARIRHVPAGRAEYRLLRHRQADQRSRATSSTLSFSGRLQGQHTAHLNLGLRYEYEPAWHDADNRFSRYLDLAAPIAEFRNNLPKMPAEVLPYQKSQPIYNGAWVFTDKSNPGTWDAQKFVLMPRAGAAIRIADKTSLRVGYARYAAPTSSNSWTRRLPAPGADFIEPPMLGVARQTRRRYWRNPSGAASDPFAGRIRAAPKGKRFASISGWAREPGLVPSGQPARH
jgi:hypothetical protein